MGRVDEASEHPAGAPSAGEPPGAAPNRRGSGLPASRSRLLTVLLAVSAGVALVGYVIGTRRAEPPRAGPARRGTVGTQPAARSYRALRRERLRPDRSTELRALGAAGPRVIPGKPSPKQHRAALAARAERRAFPGAPPVVPHGVDARSSAACLSCHEQGTVVQGKRASPLPHPAYASCTQCHVAAQHPGPAPAWQVANTFVGADPPGKGSRAGVGAPPTIPHDTWMRGACLACHGSGGWPGLRTSHPQRVSCQQCHAPSTRRSPVGLPR